MRRYISILVLSVLFLPITVWALDYSIVGDDDFPEREPGIGFTSATFNLLLQVMDKDTGKFYWKTQTGTGVGGSAGDIY